MLSGGKVSWLNLKNLILHFVVIYHHYSHSYLACCDFCISSSLTTLFVKRLFDAFYVNHNNKNKKGLTKVTKEIARYVTLTIVGVMTTIIALLVFSLTSWFTAIAADLMINNHCIFLMYNENAKYFNCICGPFHKLVGKCFNFCIRCNAKKSDGDEEEFGAEVVKIYDVSQFQSETSKDSKQLEISQNATQIEVPAKSTNDDP